MDMQHMENGLGGGKGNYSNNESNNSGASRAMAAGGGLNEIDFQRLAQTIATSIQKILQNVSTMQRMVNQFNTPQDSPELKKHLHQIMTYTHQLVSDTNLQLKEVDKCKERHLKIQRDRLVDEFTSALTAFQGLQRKTVDIEKNAVRQARANNYAINKPPSSGQQQNTGGSGHSSSSYNGSNNHSSNSNSFFEDNFLKRKSSGQLQETQMQEEYDLQALEEQERAIRELEENIVGVNEIYKKLGAMVYEQGLTVDSIESSVEQTSVFVSQGTENLRMASSYKNKMRRKKLILLGIVSAVLILVIVVLCIHYSG